MWNSASESDTHAFSSFKHGKDIKLYERWSPQIYLQVILSTNKISLCGLEEIILQDSQDANSLEQFLLQFQ